MDAVRLRRAAALLTCLVLAACGGGGTTAEPATTGATSSASASPEPMPEETGSPEPTATTELQALPESVLRPIKGLEYRRIGNQSELPPDLVAKARESGGIITGFINRQAVTKTGTTICVVQIMRLSEDLPEKDLREYQEAIAESYVADAPLTTERIAGKKARVATGVRGQDIDVIAVLDGVDLVLFSSPSLKALRRAVELYYS